MVFFIFILTLSCNWEKMVNLFLLRILLRWFPNEHRKRYSQLLEKNFVFTSMTLQRPLERPKSAPEHCLEILFWSSKHQTCSADLNKSEVVQLDFTQNYFGECVRQYSSDSPTCKICRITWILGETHSSIRWLH